MSKRVPFLPCLLIALSILGITSCQPQTGGPIPNANIRISVFASPTALVATGATNYTVSVYFTDERTNAEPGAFNDAQATANGVALTPSEYSDNVLLVSTGVSLARGDTLEVILQHAIIGTVTATATVPDEVSTFTLSPSLPSAGVANTQSSYTASWTANGNPEYIAYVYTYDSGDAYVLGMGYYVATTSHVFDADDLEDAGAPFPYLSFQVGAVAKTAIVDFATGSSIRVQSTNRAVQSNRP